MGRRLLSEEEKKSASQTMKDYRKRHAGKVKAYERIRQEKRKLARRLKKQGGVVTEEEISLQLLVNDNNRLNLNTTNGFDDEFIEDGGFRELSCKTEQIVMGQIFTRSPNSLLVDILETMCGSLDIKVVCCDGSFMWSRLLLSLLSPQVKHLLKQAEETDAFILDSGIKNFVVEEALTNLLKVEPEWKEEYHAVYNLFCVQGRTSEHEQHCDDKGITNEAVKVELFDEDNQDFNSADNEPLQVEESKMEENNIPEECSSIYHDKEKCDRVMEKPENGFDGVSQLESKVTSPINQRECTRSRPKNSEKVRKKSGVSKNEKVWIKDPSPERFMGGRKVKWICVTQENVATGPPYHCIGCSYKSNILNNVNKHYRIHSNEKPFGCKVCAKKFISSTAVTMHWNRRHNKQWIKEFSCDVCGLLFPAQGDLMRHKVVHSGEAFPCSACGKEFNTPWKRDRHEKTHTQEAIPCPICGQEFSNKRNAENHQERHGDVRNYECEICGKKSKTKRDLRIHKNVMHSDIDISCACTICDRVFKRQDLLNKHVRRVHEKSTRFQCPLCPQILSTKHHFNKHSSRCHDGQLIPVSNRVK